MDARPVYWVLCGAGATLLTSAWGNRQVTLPPQDQHAVVASIIARADLGLSQGVANDGLLLKRQAWSKPKSNPFAKAMPVAAKVVAPVAVQALPPPVSFPYVYIGRLLSDEGDLVFISKNSQVYSVAEGDTLEGVYRIDSVSRNSLEITYLPNQKKTSFSFESLAVAPITQAATALSRGDVSHTQSHYDVAMDAGGGGNEISPATEDQNTVSMPPTEEEVLAMMGSTPPPESDVLQMMPASPDQTGQAAMPEAVPSSHLQAGQ